MKHIYFVFCLLLNCFSYGQQREVQLVNTTAAFGYVEYLPEEYSEKDTLWPLIIFLHGLGEAGDGNNDLFKVIFHGPGKLISYGAQFPAIVLSPQSPTWWDIEKINEFVEWCLVNYKIDPSRLYMTGLSMGGGAAWLYGVSYPEKTAAIIPICGAAEPIDTHKLVETAVWTFHNADDPVVDVSLTYNWIAGIREAGGGPKYTIYISGGHDAWTITYENPEVWEWLFKQKLGEYVPEPLNASQAETLMVYPNPMRDKISIKTFLNTSVSLYDSFGKEIWFSEKLIPVNGLITLDISALPLNNGLYFLNINSTNSHRIVKLTNNKSHLHFTNLTQLSYKFSVSNQ